MIALSGSQPRLCSQARDGSPPDPFTPLEITVVRAASPRSGFMGPSIRFGSWSLNRQRTFSTRTSRQSSGPRAPGHTSSRTCRLPHDRTLPSCSACSPSNTCSSYSAAAVLMGQSNWVETIDERNRVWVEILDFVGAVSQLTRSPESDHAERGEKRGGGCACRRRCRAGG
ncbi:stress-inducible protein [Striga asiatica]|uniref:Stress-inducible protein n=1 Tax=Striga asiatica TaxID=4170 RepID=A0A5A7Q604_STRAF|nr:stress-inducible protein [Striga asiatica]